MRRACLLLVLAAVRGAAWAQTLSPREIEDLSRLERRPQSEAHAAAGVQFRGQGARIAGHYLRHTGTPPGPNAYFIALEAVGDADAALVLIRALVEPREAESGPEFTAGGRRQRLPRYEGEIAVALEAVLARAEVGRDARIAQALSEAIAMLRAQPNGVGRGPAERALELLGRCDSDTAREALRRLAADPDGQARALALAALGRAGRPDDAGLLVGTLQGDPQPEARRQAAAAIAQLEARAALPALQAGLDRETHPQVVDAIVQALAALEALPDDPVRCLDAAGRGWEPSLVAAVFACWRSRASDEALMQAALAGTPMVRMLAMAALFDRPSAREPLVRLPALMTAPSLPPPPGDAAVVVARPSDETRPASAPRFDEATRRLLLASAVEVLSHPARAFPDRPNAISQSVAGRLNGLLFELAGRDMRLALEYADRIASPGARTPNDGRFAASRTLWRDDPRAYEAHRRPRQALLAGALALGMALIAFFAVGTSGAIAAAVPPVAWALWVLTAGGVRELPPLPLAPLTVGGSASLTAGLVAAIAELSRKRNAHRGWLGALLTGVVATGAAGATAFVACGTARWYDVYPVGGEGWELIFDPLGAAIVAVALSALAVAAAAIVGRRGEGAAG